MKIKYTCNIIEWVKSNYMIAEQQLLSGFCTMKQLGD